MKPLTPQQLAVMQYVTMGTSNKSIAHFLGKSIKTIEKHRTVIASNVTANHKADQFTQPTQNNLPQTPAVVTSKNNTPGCGASILTQPRNSSDSPRKPRIVGIDSRTDASSGKEKGANHALRTNNTASAEMVGAVAPSGSKRKENNQ